MNRTHLSRRTFLASSAALATSVPGLARLFAQGADLVVLSSSNMRPILADLTERLERAAGRRLSVVIAEAVPVRDRVLRGEQADVVITQRPLLDELVAQGRVVAGSVVDIARSTVSMVVRAGGRAPDISSIEAFRRTLLAATSLAYPDPNAGGLAGIYFAQALERLGIAEQVKGKATLAASGQVACALVGSGDVEYGIAQTSTARAARNVGIIGTLPRELGIDIVVSGAIVTGTRQQDASAQVLAYLTSSSAEPVIRANGMEP